jgi:hypothetical protein
MVASTTKGNRSMLLLVAWLFAAAPCRSHTSITVDEAKQLVLRAAVGNAVRGTRIDAELHETQPDHWRFRAYATNTTSPSNLIGYYVVDSGTAVVTDVSGEPPYRPIRTGVVRRLQADILQRHCVR